MATTTRLLDRWGPALGHLAGDDLLAALTASEGRVVLAEQVAGAPPLLTGTANVEVLAAFGADLVCLNFGGSHTAGGSGGLGALLDPPGGELRLPGLESVDPAPRDLHGLRALLGRPVGCNLEPDAGAVPAEHRATRDRVAAADTAGAAFVVVTANPGHDVDGDDLAAAVTTVRDTAPDLVCVAGRMHHSGRHGPLGPDTVRALVDAGAHGVLIPLPGTVPGLSEATATAMAEAARTRGALSVGTIGTSQEGADTDTIRRLALAAKRVGVDVHHLGDAGVTGLARPENVYAYSVAVRGVRHTWNRMARNGRASWAGPTAGGGGR